MMTHLRGKIDFKMMLDFFMVTMHSRILVIPTGVKQCIL